MGWDRSGRPKRLRRKQKRVVLLVAIIGSLALVSVMTLWEDIQQKHKGSVFSFVSGFFSEEEKHILWESMSDEGKAIIRKHRIE